MFHALIESAIVYAALMSGLASAMLCLSVLQSLN
jgi:hypothetical protein